MRARRWLLVLGLGILILGTWLAATYGQPVSPPENSITLFILLSAACLLTVYGFSAFKKQALLILTFGLLLRILILPMDASDDVYRYLLEGQAQHHGINPYTTSPDDLEPAPWNTQLLEQVNHPDWPGIYPPGSMLLLRWLVLPDMTLIQWKLLVALVDWLTLGMVLALLHRTGSAIRWGMLYAAHPLVLFAFAGEGHLDVFMVFFVTVTLWAWFARRWPLMYIALALAFQMKYSAVILLPFLVTRENIKHAWLLPVFALAPFLAFTPWNGALNTLQAFHNDLHFNGPVHYFLNQMFDNPQAVALGTGAIFIALLLVIRICNPRPADGGLWAMGCLLLCSPTVHFWYLTWMMPLVCLVPVRGWLVWTITICFSFATQHHYSSAGEWREFPWAIALQVIPVFGLLIAHWMRKGPTGAMVYPARPTKVSDVSIIVPALNEETRLPSFLDNLNDLSPAPLEVLFCDGGSTDRTQDLIMEAGHRVLHTPKGRGRQARMGIEQARGDAVLVAHADMTLEADIIRRISDGLNRSHAPGGALGCRFDQAGPFMRIIGILNHVRARWGGLSFGDQGQFFRSDFLKSTGGFPDFMIMEDVETSLRMREKAHPLYIGVGVTASTRSWNQGSKTGKARLIIRLVVRYMLCRKSAGIQKQLGQAYESYYGRVDP